MFNTSASTNISLEKEKGSGSMPKSDLFDCKYYALYVGHELEWMSFSLQAIMMPFRRETSKEHFIFATGPAY